MKKLFEKQKTDAEWEAVSLIGDADRPEINGTTVCFFMVEHVFDEIFIKELAARLLTLGCRSFYFWGKHEMTWHCFFDETYVRMYYPDFEKHGIAMTADCSEWQTLIEDVSLGMSLCGFSPTRFVIFYDNEDDFNALCRDSEAYARQEEDL